MGVEILDDVDTEDNVDTELDVDTLKMTELMKEKVHSRCYGTSVNN